MQCILPINLNIMKTLSFQDLSLFQVKYSLPKLLLWFLRMYFSFRLTTYIQEGDNTSNKNNCDIKYFTGKAHNMNEWSHKNMLNFLFWHKTLECSKTVHVFHYETAWNQCDHVLQYKQMCFVKCTDPNQTKGTQQQFQ